MISDDEAATIASMWHSVMTWNDPGVWMYSVTSTGKVHSKRHREGLLAYIETCLPQAAECDARGDEPILLESNVADLEALKEWATAYELDEDDHG